MLGVCRASPASGAPPKEDALEAVPLCLMLPLGLQWDSVNLEKGEAGKHAGTREGTGF